MTGQATTITAGFIPLIDAAVLIAAATEGFAEAEGLSLQLVRETSWANIRDKIAVGHFDVAHMLAPMPVASNLGLTPLPAELVVPMALGTGGNTITLSRDLYERCTPLWSAADGNPDALAGALAQVIAERSRNGSPPLSFGIVHPFSSHHYELAYVLGHAGLRPGEDVVLTVVPPGLMPDALAAGQIDGFSAGEPWGSLAAMRGSGSIATTKAQIWRSSPEKVLGMRRVWADRHPDRLRALLRALYHAAQWCDDVQNRPKLIARLAEPRHLACDPHAIAAGLDGRHMPGARGDQPAIFRFAADASSFPWQSHALWFYSQMVRWGQVRFDEQHLATVRQTYRPDLYRAALSGLGITIPSANSKIEGALDRPTPVGSASGRLVLGPDGYFDGRVFDPDQVASYIAGFADRS